MSDLGRFIGTVLGTSAIPFVFSFIGALIGKKTGAWIAAVICGFMLLFGDITYETLYQFSQKQIPQFGSKICGIKKYTFV